MVCDLGPAVSGVQLYNDEADLLVASSSSCCECLLLISYIPKINSAGTFVTDQHSLAGAADNIALHRLQFSVFTAIALVFAVEGVNRFIYAKGSGSMIAVAVGWILLAMVDVSRFVYWVEAV